MSYGRARWFSSRKIICKYVFQWITEQSKGKNFPIHLISSEKLFEVLMTLGVKRQKSKTNDNSVQDVYLKMCLTLEKDSYWRTSTHCLRKKWDSAHTKEGIDILRKPRTECKQGKENIWQFKRTPNTPVPQNR